jgi:hypothetical protein
VGGDNGRFGWLWTIHDRCNGSRHYPVKYGIQWCILYTDIALQTLSEVKYYRALSRVSENEWTN